MSNNIKLSPKHGVNPTMGVCFFCGEHTGEIGLLGKIKGDAEAPKESVLSYEPCDNCKALMEQGITLIAVREDTDGRPPIASDENGTYYPTGDFMVLTEHGVNACFTEDAAKSLLKSRKGFVPEEVTQNIRKQVELATQNADDTTTADT